MSASKLTGNVVVHSSLVVKEVVVDLEACLHRTVGEELFLDLLMVDCLNYTTVLAMVALVLKGLVLALKVALSNFTLTGSVGLALICHDTVSLKEVPHVLQLSSIAGLVHLVALD